MSRPNPPITAIEFVGGIWAAGAALLLAEILQQGRLICTQESCPKCLLPGNCPSGMPRRRLTAPLAIRTVIQAPTIPCTQCTQIPAILAVSTRKYDVRRKASTDLANQWPSVRPISENWAFRRLLNENRSPNEVSLLVTFSCASSAICTLSRDGVGRVEGIYTG
jgi:hypothetical protein